MKRILLIHLLALITLTCTLTASETTIKGRIYSYWVYDLSDSADGENEFGLTRAYITLNSKLSDNVSAQITSDLRLTDHGDQADAKKRYDLIFKYVYINWKPAFVNDLFTMRIGLQPMPYSGFQNRFWSRRYLSKNLGDINKFLATADIGLSAIFGLGENNKNGTFRIGLFNGTSYTDLEEKNKHKSIHLFTEIKPFDDNQDFKQTTIGAQYLKGTRNMAFGDSLLAENYKNEVFSAGALIAYRELFNVGVDFGQHLTGQGLGAEDNKEIGFSVFGTIFLGELIPETKLLKTINLFGRLDSYDPDDDTDNNSENLFIGGIEAVPTKGFKASINIRIKSYENSDPDKSYLYFNSLYKF